MASTVPINLDGTHVGRSAINNGEEKRKREISREKAAGRV